MRVGQDGTMGGLEGEEEEEEEEEKRWRVGQDCGRAGAELTFCLPENAW